MVISRLFSICCLYTLWVTQCYVSCHSVFMKRFLKDCCPPTLHATSFVKSNRISHSLQIITRVVDIIPVDGEELVLTAAAAAAAGIHFSG
ncbi:hypothetical protein CEXT_531441 [Caerostris extrusa]|uniref:Secreted protein n=1 Tax=Caerostris extrusa TaxID=172846 RepID=A0AAV4WYD7_CAEEX|nr:hypothetical protein CEXT_531441 [Caerostris extrusa]